MKAYLFGLVLLAQPAFAAPMGEVSFAPGTQLPSKIVVSDSIWTCAGDRCSGPGDGRTVAMQRACNTLARAVGPVTAVTVGSAALAPDAVQACNAKAGRVAAAR